VGVILRGLILRLGSMMGLLGVRRSGRVCDGCISLWVLWIHGERSVEVAVDWCLVTCLLYRDPELIAIESALLLMLGQSQWIANVGSWFLLGLAPAAGSTLNEP
jgi:hypothetical protein